MRETAIYTCLVLAVLLVITAGVLCATVDESRSVISYSPFPANCTWTFEPQEDITAYELALILPVFTTFRRDEAIPVLESLPEKAKRHFRRENCEK